MAVEGDNNGGNGNDNGNEDGNDDLRRQLAQMNQDVHERAEAVRDLFQNLVDYFRQSADRDAERRMQHPNLIQGPSYYEQLETADQNPLFREILEELWDFYGNSFPIEDLRIVAFVRTDRVEREQREQAAQNNPHVDMDDSSDRQSDSE
jgi:hypothetical protein